MMGARSGTCVAGASRLGQSAGLRMVQAARATMASSPAAAGCLQSTSLPAASTPFAAAQIRPALSAAPVAAPEGSKLPDLAASGAQAAAAPHASAPASSTEAPSQRGSAAAHSAPAASGASTAQKPDVPASSVDKTPAAPHGLFSTHAGFKRPFNGSLHKRASTSLASDRSLKLASRGAVKLSIEEQKAQQEKKEEERKKRLAADVQALQPLVKKRCAAASAFRLSCACSSGWQLARFRGL
jgi:hypothetical protein